MITTKEILELMPQKPPFRFVDEIETVSETGITGYYTFPENSWYYKGHFPDFPVTPGVLLTECMAQIGLVAFGIFLLSTSGEVKGIRPAFSESHTIFLKSVFPEDKVKVVAEKVYFRMKKLKCKVYMENMQGDKMAKAELSGMII